MKKLLIIYAFIYFIISPVFSQTDVDALRYSRINLNGTARSMGVSGAFGALGADFTSLSINPAGIALYRKPEFTITPSFTSVKNESEYFGSTYKDYRYNLHFNSAGIVIPKLNSYGKGGEANNGWIGFGFAFGFNRINNFNRIMNISGVNPDNSIVDKYVEDANGTNPSDLYSTFPFGAGLAWDAYLYNPVDSIDTTNYVSIISNGGVRQQKAITSKGSMTEWLLAFGANYSNKLYIGASLGFPYILYEESAIYQESDESDTIANFKSFTLNENLKTRGLGINLKIGLIYRILDWVRIGGSIQTPTYYSLHDNFVGSISNIDLDTIVRNDVLSPDGKYDYNLFTPWKATASLAILISKYGFISADYEFIDYSLSYFNFNSGTTDDKLAVNSINNTITNKYGPAGNLRIGAEAKYEKFALRGGYAFSLSPFKSNASSVGANYTQKSFSLGFGIRESDYFIDLAFVRNIGQDVYVPYTLSNETTEGAINDLSYNHFVATLGFKF